MNNEELAFDMGFNEFCELYNKNNEDDEKLIFDNPVRNKNETFMEFLEKGFNSLIEEDINNINN